MNLSLQINLKLSQSKNDIAFFQKCNFILINQELFEISCRMQTQAHFRIAHHRGLGFLKKGVQICPKEYCLKIDLGTQSKFRVCLHLVNELATILPTIVSGPARAYFVFSFEILQCVFFFIFYYINLRRPRSFWNQSPHIINGRVTTIKKIFEFCNAYFLPMVNPVCARGKFFLSSALPQINSNLYWTSGWLA